MLPRRRGGGLREFFTAHRATPSGRQHVAWALDRFEMGCERAHRRRGAVGLPARRCARCSTRPTTPARPAWRCGWRRCAPRRARAASVQRRIEAALALERFVMGGARQPARADRLGVPARARGRGRGPPARAAARRALRLPRADLKGVADDILLETAPEPFMAIEDERGSDLRVEARDLRLPVEPEQRAGSSDRETTPSSRPVADHGDRRAPEALQPRARSSLDGVTAVRRLGLGRPRGLLGARVAVGLGAGAEIERHQHVVHVAPLVAGTPHGARPRP